MTSPDFRAGLLRAAEIVEKRGQVYVDKWLDEELETHAKAYGLEALLHAKAIRAEAAIKDEPQPRINVKIEFPLPPYAGGVWYATVDRVEREEDGSWTAVIRDHPQGSAAEDQPEPQKCSRCGMSGYALGDELHVCIVTSSLHTYTRSEQTTVTDLPGKPAPDKDPASPTGPSTMFDTGKLFLSLESEAQQNGDWGTPFVRACQHGNTLARELDRLRQELAAAQERNARLCEALKGTLFLFEEHAVTKVDIEQIRFAREVIAENKEKL